MNNNIKNLSDIDLKRYYDLYSSGIKDSVRFEENKINSVDLKFMYHLVRLLNECEMILVEGDLDLLRNREQLKSIRRGEWSLVDIETYFNDKEKQLEKIYVESKLQHSPDEQKIKQLLIDCLEHHYGSLDKVVIIVDRYKVAINKIKEIINLLDND